MARRQRAGARSAGGKGGAAETKASTAVTHAGPLSAAGSMLAEARQYKSELLERLFPGAAKAAAAAVKAAVAAPAAAVTGARRMLTLGVVPAGPAPAGGVAALTAGLPVGSNVLGVGYGAKLTGGGSVSTELAVRVYVKAKLPRAELSSAEMVPSEVNGMPTDVVAVGDLSALARPTDCGVSVGHHAITAGTLGCLVRRTGKTGRFILSNNHVLADSNAATIGDNILEPGPIDGGNPQDPIARLSDFQPIDMSGGVNYIDAAVAELIDTADVRPPILKIGSVKNPPMAASLYQSVRKHGRTTLHTVGVIVDISASIRVRFGNQLADFDDQLTVVGISGAGSNFSAGGDSGSLVVDAVTRRPVGLLFAGGGIQTFLNPIGRVLTRFRARILA